MVNYFILCLVCLLSVGCVASFYCLLKGNKKYASLSVDFKELKSEFESFQDYAYAKLDKTELLLKASTDKTDALQQVFDQMKKTEAMNQLESFLEKQSFVLTDDERQMFVENMEALKFYTSSNVEEVITCCFEQFRTELIAFREEQERMHLNSVLESLSNAEIKSMLNAFLEEELNVDNSKKVDIKPYIDSNIRSILAEASKAF